MQRNLIAVGWQNVINILIGKEFQEYIALIVKNQHREAKELKYCDSNTTSIC